MTLQRHRWLLLALPLLATPLIAQDGGNGGLQFRFNFDQRFDGIRQTNEETGESESRRRIETDLDLTLSSETRTQRLAFTLGGALNGTSASDTDREQPLAFRDPSAGLSFRQRGTTNEFNTSVRYTSQDLAFAESLRDLLDDQDNNSDDLNEGNRGTRHRTQFTLDYRGGIDGPLEHGVRVVYRDTRYTDGATQSDQTRLSARLNGAADLTPALRLNGALNFSRTERENDSEPEDESSLNLALSTTVRADRIGLTFGLTNTDAGQRRSLGTAWSRNLRDGNIGVNINLSQATDDTLGWTGGFRYTQAFPNGNINARWNTGFDTDDNDVESRRNTLSASYNHQLFALTSMNFSVATSRTETLAEGDRTDRVEVGFGLRQQLNKDWAFNIGARREFESEVDADDTTSDTLFFSIGRDFTRKF